MRCPRCGGLLQWQLAFSSIIGLHCYRCGEYLDEIVMRNRGESWAEFWKKETDREYARPLSAREKIWQEYGEYGIFSLF